MIEAWTDKSNDKFSKYVEKVNGEYYKGKYSYNRREHMLNAMFCMCNTESLRDKHFEKHDSLDDYSRDEEARTIFDFDHGLRVIDLITK